MYCKHCGNQIDSDSAFCRYCGKSQREEARQQGPMPITLETSGESEEKAIKGTLAAAKNSLPVTSPKSRKTLVLIAASIILVAALAALFLPRVFRDSRQEPPTHHELSASEIAKLSDSVLTLYVYDKNHDLFSTGSGFVVHDDRTIVTNYHVIDEGYFVEAVSEADVHYNISGAAFFDEAADIAVLQFETGTGLAPLVIADSSAVQTGDTIYAIGSPLGLKNTVSNGIISAIRTEGNQTDIQITAPISSGSSGGVLLNIYGEVVGITYASYSDGQNLNLAIPSAEFADLFPRGEIQNFEDIASFARPLGNSVENYSTSGTRLVQYGNSVFESYNGKDEIILHDIHTKESQKLGINGTNLSVYRGALYYLSPTGNIGKYDISTGKRRGNILSDYPAAAQVENISSLYVSDHGLSVVYKTNPMRGYTALIQLDFDGTIIGKIDSAPNGIIVADVDMLVGYDYKNWELDFISLPDLEIISIPVDFEPGYLTADSDGHLYISDTTESKYGATVKYDLYSGNFTRINRPDAKTYGCFVYDGKLYYPATTGTVQMSTYGTAQKTIIESYALNQICFSDDGKLYAIGQSPDADLWEFTRCYICANSNGTQLEILDTTEILNVDSIHLVRN